MTGEHWPIISRWARTVLDYILPNGGDVEELAVHDPQPGTPSLRL